MKSYKIRTITFFASFFEDARVKELDELLVQAKESIKQLSEELENEKIVVQTKRLSFNCVDEWLDNITSAKSTKLLDYITNPENGFDIFDFINIGCVRSSKNLKEVAKVLEKYPTLSCSVKFDDALDRNKAETCAEIIKEIGNSSALGNFNFCVSSVMKPFCPFYPASYSESIQTCRTIGYQGFSIGLESGGILSDAVERFSAQDNNTVDKFRLILLEAYSECVIEVIECIENLEGFIGIDCSLNPCLSLPPEKSLGSCLNFLTKLVTGDETAEFGGIGSQSLCFLITHTIQQLSKSLVNRIRTVGYNGIMLAVLEDVGLASMPEDSLTISKLVQYSSVCGVGLDTVPVPLEFDTKELALILMDMASISQKWQKPLSCRLLPVKDKTSGEMTSFDSPYLTNSKIFKLSR